jgi:hypothetical protein
MTVKVTQPAINLREKINELETKKPLGYVPAFCISGSSFTGTVFLGANVITNNGDHFDIVTGRFVAPVTGTYQFSFALTTSDTNSHFVDIHVNGSLTGYHQLQYGNQWTSASQILVLNLNAGDYVEGRKRDASYAVYNAVFSGFLIG